MSSKICAAVAVLLTTFSLDAAAQHQMPDIDFSMALTGDSIITRRLSVYREPEFCN